MPGSAGVARTKPKELFGNLVRRLCADARPCAKDFPLCQILVRAPAKIAEMPRIRDWGTTHASSETLDEQPWNRTNWRFQTDPQRVFHPENLVLADDIRLRDYGNAQDLTSAPLDLISS
jgi:hypothetical protein